MANQQGPQDPNRHPENQQQPWNQQPWNQQPGNGQPWPQRQPQQWQNQQQYQGPPPGYQQGPPPKKSKKKGCLFVVGGFILLIVLISAITSGNNDQGGAPSNNSADGQNPGSSSGASQKSGPSQTSKNSGPNFQGKTQDDLSAKPGEKLQKDGVATVSGALELSKPQYGNPILCTKVGIENGSKRQAVFNVFDWKLQDPSGTAKSPTFMTPEGKSGLSSGEIAPGGKTEGYVCFDAPQGFPSGQYVALFEPSMFSSARHAWVTQK